MKSKLTLIKFQSFKTQRRMIMKKYLACIALFLSLCLLLVACDGTNSDAQSPTTEASTTVTTAPAAPQEPALEGYSVNGHSLSEFAIVYSDEALDYNQRAAEYIKAEILARTGLELTVENVKGQRRFHPRCGTSFLILMLIVGIFISFFIDPLFLLTLGEVPHVAIRAAIKLLLLPLMMGVGYELIKFAGRHDNLFTRIISAPGMWLQRVTVLEPTDDMIECAIKAFVEVIPENESNE